MIGYVFNLAWVAFFGLPWWAFIGVSAVLAILINIFVLPALTPPRLREAISAVIVMVGVAYGVYSLGLNTGQEVERAIWQREVEAEKARLKAEFDAEKAKEATRASEAEGMVAALNKTVNGLMADIENMERESANKPSRNPDGVVVPESFARQLRGLKGRR